MTDPTPTPNLHLQPINANRRTWADLMNTNLKLIDAVVGTYFVVQNLQGAWQNSTAYTAGQAVVDVDTSAVYQCQVAHTSAALPTTFLEDRDAHSTYWVIYSTPARARGAWTAATSYAINDFVVSGAKYAIALTTHTSGSDFDTDEAAGKWSTLVDLSSVGSSVLPVPGGPADANKVVTTSVGGTGYTIIATSSLATLMGFTSLGLQIVSAGSGSAVLALIGGQPAGSYQPLDSDLTALGALTQGTLLSSVFALNDAAGLRTLAGLGTAAVLDTGTTALKVVQLDAAAKLPAVDGSQLTNLPAVAASFTTGDVKFTYKTTADSGWVMVDDGSIGSAASGATNRANADTATLYSLFWNNCNNTDAPVATGRGANAAADFAANKAISLPKSLSRGIAFSGAGAGLTSRRLGETYGAETVTLSIAQVPNLNVSVTGTAAVSDDGSSGGGQKAISTVGDGAADTLAVTATGATTNGGGGSHTNLAPRTSINGMIKL